MANIERSYDEKKRPSTKVKLGVPFNINPSIDLTKEQTEVETEVGFQNIDIEGISSGKVKIVRLGPEGENGEGELLPLKFELPAGQINITAVINNSGLRFNPLTLPLMIDVEINKLNKNQLETFSCVLKYRDKEYAGYPYYNGEPYDNIENENLEKYIDGGNINTLLFSGWFPKQGQEYNTNHKTLLFPPNLSVIRQIQLTIDQDVMTPCVS